MQKALRWLGFLAYGGAVAVVFVLSAYAAFSLFVRSGVRGVPELSGLTDIEAQALLSEQGLLYRERDGEEAYDEQVMPGRVLRQRPRSGSLVKRGSTVEVVLSRGPQRLLVPDLVGQAAQSAQVALAAVHLALGRTLGVWNDTQPPGLVAMQNPNAGARVDRAATVDLFVTIENPAETYVMPDLIYRSYDEVRAFFERQGFRLGSVKFESYEGIPRGTLLRQFPLPGHPLRKHDTISLVVAAGAGELH